MLELLADALGADGAEEARGAAALRLRVGCNRPQARAPA